MKSKTKRGKPATDERTRSRPFRAKTAPTESNPPSAEPERNRVQGTIGLTPAELDLHRVDLALRDSELRYRRLFETAQDGILILDAETGAITDINPYLIKMLGYTREELLGKKLWEVGVFQDVEASKQAFLELQQQRYIRYEDLPLRTSDGRSIEVEFVSNVYPVGDQQVIQCNIRDISERKQIERERERLLELQQAARTEAEAAVQAREQFLKVATHELRTPLATLLGYADLLSGRATRESPMTQADQRAIQKIAKQTRRIDKLISSLFDITRLESGQLDIQPSLIDVGALAARIVDEVKPEPSRHTFEFTNAAGPLMVRGDGARLVQVLQNLILNAVKYSPLSGVIRVEAVQQDGMACVAVTDQGIGIPAAELPFVFDRFYRAHNANAMHIDGLGVGLYVAKEIVRLHGGDIEVQSRVGEGSTFTVRLPLASAGEPEL